MSKLVEAMTMVIVLLYPLPTHRHYNSSAATKVEPALASLASAQCSGDTSTHIRKKKRWSPWLVKSRRCWHYARKLSFSLCRAAHK